MHIIYAFLSDSHGTRTHNYIDRKWTLNHLAKLTNWLSCAVSTYLHVALTVCLYHVTCVFRVTMCFCYQISLFYIIAWTIVALSTVDKFFFPPSCLSDTFSWSFSFYVFFTLSQIFRNYIDYKCPLFLSLNISFCPLFMYWCYFTAFHWSFSFSSTVLNMLTRFFFQPPPFNHSAFYLILSSTFLFFILLIAFLISSSVTICLCEIYCFL